MKHLLTIIALLLVLTCCTTESDRLRMRAGLDTESRGQVIGLFPKKRINDLST